MKKSLFILFTSLIMFGELVSQSSVKQGWERRVERLDEHRVIILAKSPIEVWQMIRSHATSSVGLGGPLRGYFTVIRDTLTISSWISDQQVLQAYNNPYTHVRKEWSWLNPLKYFRVTIEREARGSSPPQSYQEQWNWGLIFFSLLTVIFAIISLILDNHVLTLASSIIIIPFYLVVLGINWRVALVLVVAYVGVILLKHRLQRKTIVAPCPPKKE